MSVAEADETMEESTMAETTMIPAENYNNLINVMEEMVEKLKVNQTEIFQLYIHLAIHIYII